MKNVTMPLCGAMVLGLAACGGGGDDAPLNDVVISSGIYELELPTAEERADLPPELDDAITNIQNLNENGNEANPGGDLIYSGVWGAGFDDEDETLVTGTLEATFTAASNSVDITMTATDDNIPDADVSGSIGASGLAVSGGLFSGPVSGEFTATETSGPGVETFDAAADLRGATVGLEMFGDMEGSVENTTVGSPDLGEITTFGGLFYGTD